MKFKKYNTKKLNKKTINLNQSYKKEQKSSKRERERARERESIYSFLCGKKYGEEELKYRKEEMKKKV